jgi:hypothetical protein
LVDRRWGGGVTPLSRSRVADHAREHDDGKSARRGHVTGTLPVRLRNPREPTNRRRHRSGLVSCDERAGGRPTQLDSSIRMT